MNKTTKTKTRSFNPLPAGGAVTSGSSSPTGACFGAASGSFEKLMLGSNTLVMCPLEMNAAMTHYLNTCVLKSDHAIMVKKIHLIRDSGSEQFEIDFEPTPLPCPPNEP